MNVWDFGPLGTAITPLQRGGFPTFDTTLNSFIDIIHSTENKAIKEGTKPVISNYKSSHVAYNFVVICIMLIRTLSWYMVTGHSQIPQTCRMNVIAFIHVMSKELLQFGFNQYISLLHTY